MRGGFSLWLFSFFMALALVCGTAAAVWAVNTYRGEGITSQDRIFIVARGQGVAEVADGLTREAIIDQPLLFRAAARITKADRNIHAGEYLFPAYMSMEQILAKMVAGDVVKRQVTVREGLTSWQVMKLVEKAEGMEGEIKDPPREGTLLPETYSYLLKDSRDAMIAQMKAAMDKTVAELWPLRNLNTPVKTEKEALVLASIVEKETGTASERKTVAGVFVNRLRLGMPLQSDPTVIYAMTSGLVEDKGQGPIGRRLLTRDLQFDSPYNTYKYTGLPPGPICNPGRASIEAVLHPESHEYIFFVADGKGGHAFAKTLEEHNANVEKWRAIRAQSGD